MRLLLVRHGETAWNVQRRLQGRRDVPLSAAGRAQVRRLATVVHHYQPDRVVTSPLSRAHATATLLGYPTHAVDDRWQEADLGSWTGQSPDELPPDDYTSWRDGVHTPPGAESFQSMTERAAAALADLAGGATTLVVTHGGPVRALCHWLVGLAPHALIPVDPASLTVIELNGRPRLRAYGITARPLSDNPPD